MVITIEDSPNALLELLWLREAWRLDPEGDDLPPHLTDTPALVPESERASAPIAEWREAWPQLWRACLDHAARPVEPGAHERLDATPPGSAQRTRMLADLVGPSWSDRFGRDGLTPDQTQWRVAFVRERLMPRMTTSPEHSALDTLIPAWKSGLTRIVQLPCRGSFTQIVGPHGLSVTMETRYDPVRYREALATFR
jgi:hypothetical protein